MNQKIPPERMKLLILSLWKKLNEKENPIYNFHSIAKQCLVAQILIKRNQDLHSIIGNCCDFCPLNKKNYTCIYNQSNNFPIVYKKELLHRFPNLLLEENKE